MPTDNDQDTDNPRDLRTQLAEANKAIAKLTQDNRDLHAAQLMPTLNARQRRVVMRELEDDKLDLTEDNVKSVADDLGYSLAPETPPPPPPNGQADSDNGDGTPDEDDDLEPGEIKVSLSEMSAIDRANYNARRGNVSKTLDQQMKDTKSREELRDLIRTKGGDSGLVHEWDDQ